MSTFDDVVVGTEASKYVWILITAAVVGVKPVLALNDNVNLVKTGIS